jgi:H+/Cl- antiporter ClcA
MLLVIYFINLIYLSSTPMFLFWRNSYVSLPMWLLIIIILASLFGAISVLFLQTLIRTKPKDIFDEDF